MSYSTPVYSSASPHQHTAFYQSQPPAPPPKPAGPSTPSSRGPPLPPPPNSFQHAEPSELSADQAPSSRPIGLSIPGVEPDWLPDSLKDKSTSDLHALLSTPALQAALLDNPSTTHPSIPASQAVLDPLINTNLTLGTSLESLGTRLASQRAQTQSRLLALRALEQQHRTKIAETEAALRSFSPQALYQRLSASVAEQEQLLRGIEQSWVEESGMAGEREVGEWVRRVREASRVAFLRRERKARWDEGRVGGWR